MKKLLMGFITFCIVLPVLSQDKTMMDILESTNWKLRTKSGEAHFKTFKDNRINSLYYSDNKKYQIEFLFYLSDSIDTKFDQSKMENKNGKYIIWLNQIRNLLYTYAVNELTEETFIIESTSVLFGENDVHVQVYDSYEGPIE